MQAFDYTSQGEGDSISQLWSVALPVARAPSLAWSPDGSLIAVQGIASVPNGDVSNGDDHPSFAVYLLNAETGEIDFTLPDTVACPGQPWTADGERLIVRSSTDELTYRAVNLSGTEDVLLGDSLLAAIPSHTEPDLVAYLEPGISGEFAGAITVSRMGTGQSQATVRVADELSVRRYGWLDDGRVWFMTGPRLRHIDCATR